MVKVYPLHWIYLGINVLLPVITPHMQQLQFRELTSAKRTVIRAFHTYIYTLLSYFAKILKGCEVMALIYRRSCHILNKLVNPSYPQHISYTSYSILFASH